MSVYYITAARKQSGCNSEQEIAGYRVSSEQTNSGSYYAKRTFFDTKYSANNIYYAYDPDSGILSQCSRKMSENDELFLQSQGNNLGIDSLLKLPNI